ncbi:MAG: class I adenylate-forming enzyme family protein [Yoonia sp.]|uniref:class I adenylate-forming enzyme family protein n=1 Tax=Yoonia sp. TaxID=2212373 RepID=UPI003EF1D984
MADRLSQEIERKCRANIGSPVIVDGSGEVINFDGFLGTLLAFAEEARARGISAGELVAVDVKDATAADILVLSLLRLGASVIRGKFAALEKRYGIRPDHMISDHDPSGIRLTQDWIRAPGQVVDSVSGGVLVRATSGTTGKPKLRAVTTGRMLASLQRSQTLRAKARGASFCGYRPGSAPALNYLIRSILNEHMMLRPQVDQKATLQAMADYAVTDAYVSPYGFTELLQAVEGGLPAPASLSRVVVGGGGVSYAYAKRAEQAFGAQVINTYGSSETSSIAHVRVVETSGYPGCVGQVYDDLELRLGHSGGRSAAGDPGEIEIRVPQQLRCTSFPSGEPVGDADGWVKTGDIGQVLPDGRLQLLGRTADRLQIGGAKVAPGVFEAMAEGVPGLVSAAAFGVPSEAGTEDLGLALVTDDGFDLHAFARHMYARLGPTFPMQIAEVDAFPMTPAGKVDRPALSRLFRSAAAQEDAVKSSQTVH